jgi:spore coat polysaccharide biosynthesis predicted glycosyltransferase SpsG
LATIAPKHILIAPLDWGLGHTTRCVPLIRQILSLGHVPVFAGNASQRSFIEETFGAIDNIHLEGYNITYSGWNKVAQAGLLSQLPSIQRTINTEHKWLMQLCLERQIDGIISDNRYGLFHSAIPTVILTHQLQVQTGLGNLADRAIQKIHYKYLERFNETWVVDAGGNMNLGGKLSHPTTFPHGARYIGLLSRFGEKRNSNNEQKSGPILILLSGPEPQRSILAQMLWQQAVEYKEPITFVEGSDTAYRPKNIPSHITWYNRLTNEQLAPLLNNAAMVICRSGYSTLMDLVAMWQKAIVIPTPGQTEQKYLGHNLHEKGIFYSAKQGGFKLGNTLDTACEFPYHRLELNEHFLLHKQVLEDWIVRL